MTQQGRLVERRILLAEQGEGSRELFVFCPLRRSSGVLERCVACQFYRGLRREEGCSVLCLVPDAVFSRQAAGGSG